MKSSTPSEIKKGLRKVLLFAKIEKYIQVGNQRLLTFTKTFLDQSHKVTQLIKGSDIRQSLNISKKWLLETPERALANAYDTALMLKNVEDKYFSGEKISSISSYSNSASTYFELASKKYLLIIQVRLLEFKVSNSVLDTATSRPLTLEMDESCPIIARLNFIDAVLTRYSSQQAEESEPDFKATSFGAAGQSNRGFGLENRDLVGNQGGSQRKLLEHLNSTLSNVGSHLDPQTDPQTETKINVQSPPRSSQPHSSKAVFRGVGLASVLFAGGFAAGGATSWAIMSAQGTTAQSHDSLRPTEARSRQSATQTTIGLAAIAAPTRLPPEPSTSMHPKRNSAPANTVAQGQNNGSHFASHRLLALGDLQGLSRWDLKIRRNEIYARHGRQFTEPELQQYFENQSWYQPRYAPHEFSASLLSPIELSNAIFIREYQRTHNLL
jgi:hypothetical protein